MGYDETLAARVRRALARRRGLTEQWMFGGLAFLLDGRMCCGVIDRDLVVRVGRPRYEEALARPHVRQMDFTGRPLRGYVYIAPGGCASDPQLREWVGWGVDVVATLPAKAPRPPRAAKRRSGT